MNDVRELFGGEANSFDKFMDFVETADNWVEENPAVARLFATYESRLANARKGSKYQSSFKRFVNMMYEVQQGHRPGFVLQEAMTTSDFPVLTADILSRRLEQQYVDWPKFAEQHATVNANIRDFRVQKLNRVLGTSSLGTAAPAIPELGEYPRISFVVSETGYQVAKYGQSANVSMEALRNDYLGIFNELPRTLAYNIRLMEELNALQVYCAATGPAGVPSVFSTDGSTNGGGGGSGGPHNLIGDALGVSGIKHALIVMRTMRDANGKPIMITPKYLEVPPELEWDARAALSPGRLFTADQKTGSSVTTTFAIDTNPVANTAIDIIVNPLLSWFNTTNGTSAWYLWGDPVQHPAQEIGFLEGRRNPAFMFKVPDQQYVGGGLVPMEMGNFDHDEVDWKSQHFMGAIMRENRYVVASKGDGT